MTVPELKSQLKVWRLPVSGKKAELIERLEDHELNNLQPTGSQQSNKNDKKRTISFPPPKDDTEVQVMDKEVQETVRMLEGLKLGGSTSVISDSQKVPSKPEGQLTQQQKQQQKLMKELKQSLHESQNQPQQTSKQSVSESKSELIHHYEEKLRLKPANDLKEELSNLRLPTKGRKPDLVDRLAKYYVAQDEGRESGVDDDDEDMDDDEVQMPAIVAPSSTKLNLDRPMLFAGIARLSTAATNALQQAFSDPEPTPIQKVAIPKLLYAQQSALLHAPTGSGKTLTYILPITETLWKEVEDANNDSDIDPDAMENGISLVLLPTRELAAQVAGIASVLAPKGMVKLVPRPMNLMSLWKAEADRGEEYEYYENEGNGAEPTNSSGRTYKPRILVGSAKSISLSLFGDKKMPAPPTSKPEGKSLLSSTRWLVMDEVDRLLNVKKSRTDKSFKRHEKPAAMLAAAIARLTKGRVQVIAASATVGRPIRRELSRVLGLNSSECPETLRGEEDTANMERKVESDETHIGRAVKIPDTVKNYVLPVDGSTTGTLLTSAAFAAKTILSPPNKGMSSRKVLLVLTRGSDIKVHNALGALRHFGIDPEPQSLLDALEVDGTDRLMEAHRKVSRVVGLGGSKEKKNKLDSDDGYLLITHEDNVRGLHLDRLDAVIVVGRPGSPDEYTHIAGRTGRAGREGSVLNIVSYEQAAALASWTKMLSVDFLPIDESQLNSIV